MSTIRSTTLVWCRSGEMSRQEIGIEIEVRSSAVAAPCIKGGGGWKHMNNRGTEAGGHTTQKMKREKSAFVK